MTLFVCTTACHQDKNQKVKESHKYTNELVDETSPYLLQHAHNPVNWVPWSDDLFEKAKETDKLVLISIGYSACHWCHVMEHQSFEDEEVAAYMNEHFICVKVDREEFPDVDHVYMKAVQMMSGQGGWPLNCFTLPDGRPIFGGTYFPKDKWLSVMKQIVELRQERPQEFLEYANKITSGLKSTENLIKVEPYNAWDESVLTDMVGKWQTRFDNVEGGAQRAPKFPLPNNYIFLLRYGHLYENAEVLNHVYLTLNKMAQGGIYDQIGGGFARYSVDALWKVPHFEKMLYDNAQLLQAYSEAYTLTKNEEYRRLIEQTVDYIEEEMLSSEGAFYSALDADSEGEEGKFYVWKKDELQEILGDQFDLASKYYNVNEKGFWEHGNYILLRSENRNTFIESNQLDPVDFEKSMQEIHDKLKSHRSSRVKPGLDDKTLTSWNALMDVGLIAAYRATGNARYYDLAKENIQFLLKQQWNGNTLKRNYKDGSSSINGFLEDYCFLVEALCAMHQADLDESWLFTADELCQRTIELFFDEEKTYFYFKSIEDQALISRPIEIEDNVIPASNSSMAKNLMTLGTLLDNESYLKKSDQLLSNVYQAMPSYGSAFSNWGILALQHLRPNYVVALAGENYLDMKKEMEDTYLPNVLFVGGESSSKLPLMEGKFVPESTIYVCTNGSCKQPVNVPKEALKQIVNED